MNQLFWFQCKLRGSTFISSRSFSISQMVRDSIVCLLDSPAVKLTEGSGYIGSQAIHCYSLIYKINNLSLLFYFIEQSLIGSVLNKERLTHKYYLLLYSECKSACIYQVGLQLKLLEMRRKEGKIQSNYESLSNSTDLHQRRRFSKSETTKSKEDFIYKKRGRYNQGLAQQKSFLYKSLQVDRPLIPKSGPKDSTFLKNDRKSSGNKLEQIERKSSEKNGKLCTIKPNDTKQANEKSESRSRINSSQKILKISQGSQLRKGSSIINSFPFTNQRILHSRNSFDSQMRQLNSFYDEDSLFIRLSSFSKEKGTKMYLRVYKDDLHNLISHRYGRDRVSSFLQFQYIQDFYSIQRLILTQLLKFTNQEVLLFCYIIMDQNKDGLLTADDLSSFVGEKNENMAVNSLVMEDLNDIIKYIQKRQQNGEKVDEKVSCDHPFFLEQGLSLASYRKFQYQKEKIAKNEEKRRRLSKLISSNPHKALFTLQKPMNQIIVLRRRKQNIKELSFNLLKFIKKPKKEEQETSYLNSFCLNFLTFSKIFKDKIPKTFIDFLYFMGGVECPNLTYAKVQTQLKQESPSVGSHDLYRDKQRVFYQLAIKLKEDIKYNSEAYRVLKTQKRAEGESENDQNLRKDKDEWKKID